MRNEIFNQLLKSLTPSVVSLAEELGCSEDYLYQIARGEKAGIKKSKELADKARLKANVIITLADKLSVEAEAA